MSQALKKLINLMELEKIEEGLFRGQSEDLGLPQVFGGQVVGKLFMRQNKQLLIIAMLIHFTAIFYDLVIAISLLFTMWNLSVMVAHLVLVASVLFNKVSLFFI